MELVNTAADPGTIMERMRLQTFLSEAEMELVKMAAGPGTIMEGMWLQAENLDQKLKIPGRGANRYNGLVTKVPWLLAAGTEDFRKHELKC